MPIVPTPLDVHAAASVSPALIHLHGFWDPFSAASHLVGAIVFLILGVRLVRRAAPDRTRQIAMAVYAISGVALLLLSGLYHMATAGTALSRLLVRLDHAAIFFLIAGTFTPIHTLLFRGVLRWLPLTFIWCVALVGAILKTLYFYSVPESVGLTLFLVMGWLGLVGGFILLRREGLVFVRPLLLGGFAFSAAALMEFFRWPTVLPGFIHAHEVFHVAALIGYAFHFSFMWSFARPTGETAITVPSRRTASQPQRHAHPHPARHADSSPVRYEPTVANMMQLSQ
jgi:channel protein (hemolysin III family)